MKYFKSGSGELYAFEADGSQDAFIPNNLTPITEAEADSLRAPPPFNKDEAIKAILPAREMILNRLTGIRQDAEDAQDTDLIEAIKVARQGIKDLPTAPGILTATDSDSFRTALIAAYGKIVASAPDALQKVFREISL